MTNPDTRNRPGSAAGHPADAAATSPAASPAAAPTVPDGFTPLPSHGSDFIGNVGPLYLRHGAAAEGAEAAVWVGFRVEPRHCNPMGICHGGMIATFCDMLLPLSIHRKSPAVGFRFLPTIGLQIDYLAPSPLGAWVQGEAQVLRVTRSMVFAQGLVTADGVPVARCSGTFKIGPPFDPRQGLAARIAAQALGPGQAADADAIARAASRQEAGTG